MKPLHTESNHLVVTSINCKGQESASSIVTNIRINPWMLRKDCDDLVMTSWSCSMQSCLTKRILFGSPMQGLLDPLNISSVTHGDQSLCFIYGTRGAVLKQAWNNKKRNSSMIISNRSIASFDQSVTINTTLKYSWKQEATPPHPRCRWTASSEARSSVLLWNRKHPSPVPTKEGRILASIDGYSYLSTFVTKMRFTKLQPPQKIPIISNKPFPNQSFSNQTDWSLTETLKKSHLFWPSQRRSAIALQ